MLVTSGLLYAIVPEGPPMPCGCYLVTKNVEIQDDFFYQRFRGIYQRKKGHAMVHFGQLKGIKNLAELFEDAIRNN